MDKAPIKSEDILGKKFDRCLADSLIKIGVGLAVGSVLSLVVFKRRKWPIILGTGIGVGMGIANCQNTFQEKGSFKSEITRLKEKYQDSKPSEKVSSSDTKANTKKES